MSDSTYPANMQKLLLVVQELHTRGYGLLRITPALSPSGLHWRCTFHDSANNHSTHASNWLTSEFNLERPILTPISEIADSFERSHQDLLSLCLGRDNDYTLWFSSMISRLRPDELPYAFADYFYQTDHWLTNYDQRIYTLPNMRPHCS